MTNELKAKKKRRPAAPISILRILLSVCLPFTEPFTVLCSAIYALCGLTDILDGVVARATGTDDERGARLDTLADCFFVAAALITFLPVVNIPSALWMIAGVILAVKAVTLLISVIKFKRPLLLHTYLNKLTGCLLFLAPLVWRMAQPAQLGGVLCAVAGAAALEELLITIVSHYPRPNRTALLQKRHIKYVLYGTWMRRCLKARRHGGTPQKIGYGVNFVGNLSGATAQAQSSRLVLQGLERSGIPVFSDDHPSFRHVFIPKRIPPILRERRTRLPYNVTVLRIDAAEMPEFCARRGTRFFRENYIIGYWLWEQAELEPEHIRCLDLIDEIWTPSEFVSTAVRRYTDKPVYTMPYAVEVVSDSSFDHAHFGLPEDRLLYMIGFDGDTESLERKNPIEAASAFASAFPDGSENVGLIVKAVGASKFELNAIRDAVGVGKPVYPFTKKLPKGETDSLLACADVLISLHRGESFGLSMAEAMLLGKPVVASAWSANMEYMDNECACLVPCTMETLEHECPPYHKGSVWAKPDAEKAAALIKLLYTDSEKREFVGRMAKERAEERFGAEQAVEKMSARLAELLPKAKPEE